MSATVSPGVDATLTGTDRWVVRFLPSLTDFAFAFPILWLFYMMAGTTTLLADGDTAWHLRTGDWIWQTHAVPTTDLFSFTRPHDAWYAWEWLWDLLFSGIHRLGGLGAVAFVNICLISVASVMLFRLIRRTTDNDILSFVCTMLAMATSSVHWLARPHLFSWLFILGFAHALLSVKRGNVRALIPLPFCMILWTNLHGAFFLGIFMLLLAATGEIITAFLHAQDFWDAVYYRTRSYVACAFACGAATFVNPYGWRLHSHIFQYVGDKRLLGQIGEFRSMDFHGALGLLFEIMLILALPGVLWACIRRQYGAALSLCFWAHLALYSARNIPLFALLSAPFIALWVQDVAGRAALTRRLRQSAALLTRWTVTMRPLERMGRLHVCSAGVLLVVAASFAAGLPGCEGEFHKASFPVSALNFVGQARFSRLFTTDTWASYFVYNLYPKQPTFLDGRSDFFGSDLMERYTRVINARWDWEETLSKYSVDGVVLRPDAPVVSALKASRNWHLLFDDGSVVVFGRTQAASSPLAARVIRLSPVRRSGRKQLGPSQPGLIVSSKTKSLERRS